MTDELPAGLERREGWIWPATDREAWNAVWATRPDLDRAISLCERTRVAVQAGGNAGVWPAHLASRFDWVYTFEPDALNFMALTRNVARPNVFAYRAALGTGLKNVHLEEYRADNRGAGYVAEGGPIPVLQIDALNLEACDLIALDTEGTEAGALMGAAMTIVRHKPVVMFEEKHWQRYGNAGPREVMEKHFRYKVAAEVHRDVIMVRA